MSRPKAQNSKQSRTSGAVQKTTMALEVVSCPGKDGERGAAKKFLLGTVVKAVPKSTRWLQTNLRSRVESSRVESTHPRPKALAAAAILFLEGAARHPVNLVRGWVVVGGWGRGGSPYFTRRGGGLVVCAPPARKTYRVLSAISDETVLLLYELNRVVDIARLCEVGVSHQPSRSTE